jgi:hypothetical protein
MSRVTDEHLEQWVKWIEKDDTKEALRAMQHILDTGGVNPDPTPRNDYSVVVGSLDPNWYSEREAALEVKLTEEGIIADVWIPPNTRENCIASCAITAQDMVDNLCVALTDYKPGLVRTCWSDVSLGDTVYIDNYQDGEFPSANPKVCGPFTVVKGNGCGRCLKGKRGTFMHYPNNLLRRSNHGQEKSQEESHESKAPPPGD